MTQETTHIERIRVLTPEEGREDRALKVDSWLASASQRLIEGFKPFFFDDSDPSQFDGLHWQRFQAEADMVVAQNQERLRQLFITNPDGKIALFELGRLIQRKYIEIADLQRAAEVERPAPSLKAASKIVLGSQINIPGLQNVVGETDIWTKRHSIRQSNGLHVPTTWDGVKEIHRTRGTSVEKAADLAFWVELPLYEAVVMLYQAGIQTTESNAHFEDFEQEAPMVLTIVWDSLSQPQKNAALVLCSREPEKWSFIPQHMNPDGFAALALAWKINKNKVSPRSVRLYVNSAVRRLIAGRIQIRPER